MIENPFAPGAAKGRVVALREQQSVLDRDAALIVVAIQRPGLQLASGQLAFVHPQMKGMAVMIAGLADRAEAVVQLLPGEEFGFCRSGVASSVAIRRVLFAIRHR